MRFKSIKTKIVFWVSLLLTVIGVSIITYNYIHVEKAVMKIEEKAYENILNLLILYTDAKYEQLEDIKLNTGKLIRAEGKHRAILAHDILSNFYTLQLKGLLPRAAARKSAFKLIEKIGFENAALTVLDASGRIIATEDENLKGLVIEGIGDHLAKSKALESHHGIITLGNNRLSAHFKYHPGWKLFACSLIDLTIIDNLQEDRQRRQIVEALKKTFDHLKIAETGYAYLTDENGPIINRPPDFKGFERGRDFRSLNWRISITAPISELSAPAGELAFRQSVIISASFVLAIGLIAFLVAHIAKPLRILTQYAKELPSHDFMTDTEDKVPIDDLPVRYRDEVGRLAESLIFMRSKLTDNICNLVSLTSEKEKIQSELNIARNIQIGMLPTRLPVRKEFDLFSLMKTAKAVGGDLYDYFFIDDSHLCFTIGDVSDKGVPAALFMSITKSLIKVFCQNEENSGRARRKTDNKTPSMIMKMINNVLNRDNPNEMFVTLWLGILDIRTGELTYANAGHNSPVLISRGHAELMRAKSGPIAGVFPDMPYKEFTGSLEPGDTLFLYTDGVTEAMNPEKEDYGEDRLLADIETIRNRPVEQIVSEILERVDEYAGDEPQSDDIAMLSIRYYGE